MLGPAWTFAVPGNNPLNTSDPSHYTLKSGLLSLMLRPGNLQHAFAHNVATVPLAASNTGDYSIETKVNVGFDKIDGYPCAGLVVLSDTDNFVVFSVKHNDYKGGKPESANFNFPSVFGVASPSTRVPGLQVSPQVSPLGAPWKCLRGIL